MAYRENNNLERSHALAHGALVQSFFRPETKIWIQLKPGEKLEFRIRNKPASTYVLYLEAYPDLINLIENRHWDMYGNNIFDAVEQKLNTVPDLITGLTIKGPSPAHCKQVHLHQISTGCHPVIRYFWAWLCSEWGNQSPTPGTYDEYKQAQVQDPHLDIPLPRYDWIEPEQFLCHLTHKKMTRPMLDPYGRRFEYEAIIAHLEQKGKAPFTEQPMTKEELQEDEVIKELLNDPNIHDRIDTYIALKELNRMEDPQKKSARDVDLMLGDQGGFGQDQICLLLNDALKGQENVDIPVIIAIWEKQQNDFLTESLRTTKRWTGWSYDVDPTGGLRHQIALVIDKTNKKIYFCDSLKTVIDANWPSLDNQLQDLKNKCNQFKSGYELVNKAGRDKQQGAHGYDRSAWGIYTYLNCLKLIDNEGEFIAEKLPEDMLHNTTKNLLQRFDKCDAQKLLGPLAEIYREKYKSIQAPDGETMPMQDLYVNLTLVPETQQEIIEETKSIHDRNQYLQAQHDMINSAQPIDRDSIFNYINGKKVYKVLLMGAPGIGKTTLCLKMLFEWSSDEIWRLKFKSVFMVPLRNINQLVKPGKHLSPSQFPSLEIWLCQVIKHILDSQVTIVAVEDYLKQYRSRVLIILDGYDEASQILKETIWTFIEEDKSLNQQLHILVTSRRGDFQQLHQLADIHIENIGFSEDQINQYIHQFVLQNYSESNMSTEESKIQYALRLDHSIKSMTSSPLLLYYLLKIHKRDCVQFYGSKRIYLNILEMIWEKALSKNNSTLQGKKEITFNNLAKLAKYTLDHEKIIFTRRDIRKSGIIDADYSISHLINSEFLVVQGEFDEVTYSFIHLTIQEFLVAQYIFDRHRDQDYKIEKGKNVQSEQVLLFLAQLIQRMPNPQNIIARGHAFIQKLQEVRLSDETRTSDQRYQDDLILCRLLNDLPNYLKSEIFWEQRLSKFLVTHLMTVKFSNDWFLIYTEYDMWFYFRPDFLQCLMEEMVRTDFTGINVEDWLHHDNIRFNNITMLSFLYFEYAQSEEFSNKAKEIFWEFLIQFLPKLGTYLRAFGNFRHQEYSTGWRAILFLQRLAEEHRDNGEVRAFIESIEADPQLSHLLAIDLYNLA